MCVSGIIILTANHDDSCFAADSMSAGREARKQQPDLIILDLGLPAGDGFIVLERFRANTNLALIPVIVVSARDLHGNKERALKAGASCRSRGMTVSCWRSSASSSINPTCRRLNPHEGALACRSASRRLPCLA